MFDRRRLLIAAIAGACISWAAYAESGASVTADSQQRTVHFNLLGPDWARIPEGHAGVTPMKVVAELNIPRDYLTPPNPFRPKPLMQDESSIPVDVLYPSMKGAAEAQSSESKIGLIIHAAREDALPKGIQAFYSDAGRIRDSRLDNNGLCGYTDNKNPGYYGNEFYISCNKSDRTFDIICFPRFNDHRVCNETAFLGNQIGGQLIYQHETLKEHQAILDSIRKLVTSFVELTTVK